MKPPRSHRSPVYSPRPLSSVFIHTGDFTYIDIDYHVDTLLGIKSIRALLNRKFHISQISHRVKNWCQNVTFGRCEICVWSISIILGVSNLCSNISHLSHLSCEELVRIRAICEGLVRFFSDVKNRYSIFTNVKNWYHFISSHL